MVQLKILLAIICGLALLHSQTVRCQSDENSEDNDFAEFDDFDSDDGFATVSEHSVKNEKANNGANEKNGDFQDIYEENDDDDGVVEEESEFEHFRDDEEFEGFSKNEPAATVETGEPKLTMAKVPLHFRTHWDSYWMEILMLAGLAAYFANYFIGKNKNTKLANLWLSTHKSLLDDNFLLIGDDGKVENDNPGFVKESESLYTLWCSGRTCCEGMLVELKMIKRQDLVAILSEIVRPSTDQIHFKVEISKDSMDSFVFCVASRRTATKLFKETADLVSSKKFNFS